MCSSFCKECTSGYIHWLTCKGISNEALDVYQLSKGQDVRDRFGRRHGQFATVGKELLNASFEGMKKGWLVQHHDQCMKPEVQQDEIGPLARLDVVLKIGCIEVEFWRQALVDS